MKNTHSEEWHRFLKILSSRVNEGEFSLWLSKLDLFELNLENLILNLPHELSLKHVQKNYLDYIKESAWEIWGPGLQIRLQVAKKNTFTSTSVPSQRDTFEKNRSSSLLKDEDFFPQEIAKKRTQLPYNSLSSSKGTQSTLGTNLPKKSLSSKEKRKHPQLTQLYTFENFVIGDNNQFAYNAAFAIARQPGEAYNPCLIYGGVGLGKTHLLQSIGNEAYWRHPNLRIVYLTAESFVNEFVESIRSNETNAFKAKYRSVDILLIDDIHDLQNKKETQEELFHTFNALYEAHKQMVFSCDRPASELKNFTERLKNRFERGLNVDLQKPRWETRFAILKKKMEISPQSLDDDVLRFIARNVRSNIRDLEAAMVRLLSYRDLMKKPITLSVAQEQLEGLLKNPLSINTEMLSPEAIKQKVSEFFGVSLDELSSRRRTQSIVWPRQVAMYALRQLTDYSTTEIGSFFGDRDHTTVIHALKSVTARMKKDQSFLEEFQRLLEEIQRNEV